jgi:hypothetical protein
VYCRSIIAATEKQLWFGVAFVQLTTPDYLRRVGIFGPGSVMRIKITQKHNYESGASIVIPDYTTYTLLDIVTANGSVPTNVAYELTAALKERFQFLCRDNLHMNFMRDLRTALHSRATFVSFCDMLRNRHL